MASCLSLDTTSSGGRQSGWRLSIGRERSSSGCETTSEAFSVKPRRSSSSSRVSRSCAASPGGPP
eukprot:scaffold11181_cov75-Phaeocystis_antarctica.AAC.3